MNDGNCWGWVMGILGDDYIIPYSFYVAYVWKFYNKKWNKQKDVSGHLKSIFKNFLKGK